MFSVFVRAACSNDRALGHRDDELIVRKAAALCAAFVYGTPIRSHLYLWEKRVSVEAGTRQVTKFSREEHAALEAFLHTRGFGEVDFDFAAGRAASAIFASLADRLEFGS